MSTTEANARGQLVCVLGPSGAGKDSVLAWLMAHWQQTPALHWARRTITRPADAGGELHEAMDLASFERLREAGGFAWCWAAHGLHYGVRHAELAGLAQGACVLVNGSRAHLPAATAQFPGMAVLHITASAATLTARLQARNRELPEDIQRRIERNQQLPPLDHPLSLTVANDGALVDAGHTARQWLEGLLAARKPAALTAL
jgi:ribose 1,5-bisphosphokinase